MDNLSEVLSLYDPTNLPERIKKEMELKRWREIMAQQKYRQDYLDGFLKADAEAREAMIAEEARQLHLAREFCRYDNAQRLCKNENTRAMLERCKMQAIKLMQRQ